MHTQRDSPSTNLTIPAIPFKPNTYFFFYGSLMDPEVLQKVINLPEPPQVQKGWMAGFKAKMWGIYPAIVQEEGCKVSGTLYKLFTAEQLQKLVYYETSACKQCPCVVYLEGGAMIDAQTFCWAGDPESRELEEGEFDFA